MILLLSTSDTDLLSARASDGPVSYRYANPSRLPLQDLPQLLDGVDLVVVRLLGGVRAWQDGLDQVLATGRPVVVLTGEQAPDAQLMAASTVPIGIAAEAHAYLAHGGPANLDQLARFLSDTVLLTGHGFAPPAPAPSWGPLERTARRTDGPVVAVLYYRAHHMSGNTAFVDALCSAVEDAGARALPLYVASLRTPEPELIDALRAADAIVTTVLAAGGTRPAEASAGGDDESWDAGVLSNLDVPILQALCLTGSRTDWEDNDEGVSPLDAASQIAVPEFDGRLITVPFSFKEIDEDGLPAYVADTERAARVAGIAVRHARLRHIPAAEKRIALVLSAYPTKHSRIGNAVGLDTPASAVALLRRLRDQGYDFGTEEVPGLVSGDGDELIRALIEAAWATTRSGSPRSSWPATRSGSPPPTTGAGTRPSRPSSARPSSSTGAPPRARCSWTGRATRTATSCSPPCAAAICSSSSSRRAASARTRSRSTTTPICRPRTTTWPPTAGSPLPPTTTASAPTR